MKLKEAIDIAINEAESSALGDNNKEVLEAVELLREFYLRYGYFFEEFDNRNFSLPHDQIMKDRNDEG
jgi:hypothetical protein|tara:strand:- start:1299 stop:1502 length:204 start_codon:yes stop_codon:yes gene_type:complete